jgi:hypothetical protein
MKYLYKLAQFNLGLSILETQSQKKTALSLKYFISIRFDRKKMNASSDCAQHKRSHKNFDIAII